MSATVAVEPHGSPPTAAVETERRLGRVIGPLTLLSVGLALAAAVISARGARDVAGAGSLVTFAEHDSTLLVAVALRTGSVALTVPFMLLWHRLLRSRDPAVSAAALAAGIASSVLIATSALAGWFTLDALAADLAAEHYASEQEALDASTALDLVRWADIAARLVFAAWLGYASLRAGRVGLLTPSLGVWGVLAALTGMVSPAGDALYLGWLASAGLLLSGYWPGGRPASWATGRTESWTGGHGRTDNVRSPQGHPEVTSTSHDELNERFKEH